MEDLEAMDYSSDRLESTDIWGVPGGGLLQQVDLPKLGPADLVSNLGSSPLVEDFSPSIFLNSPVPVGSLADFLPYPSDGMLDRPRGRDLDVPPCYGGSPILQEGFGHLEGFVQVGSFGWAGLPQTGDGRGGSLPVEDWRPSLGLAEHRGFGSPRGGLPVENRGVLADSAGRKVGEGGPSKRRRRNCIKTKKLQNYAIGEDLAWDSVL